MPNLSEIGARIAEFIPEFAKGLTTKAIPELAERKAAPHAEFAKALATPPPEGQITHGVGLRGADVPIADESMREAARTTAAPIPRTASEIARAGKDIIMSFSEHEPGMPV